MAILICLSQVRLVIVIFLLLMCLFIISFLISLGSFNLIEMRKSQIKIFVFHLFFAHQIFVHLLLQKEYLVVKLKDFPLIVYISLCYQIFLLFSLQNCFKRLTFSLNVVLKFHFLYLMNFT